MWQPSPLLLVVSLCVLVALSSPCTVAGDGGGKPLVTAITKDASTSLYTAPLKDGHPLVLDLSGPILWSTCAASHHTLECHSNACMRAHRYHPSGCPHTGYGEPDTDAGNPYRCKCTAHPRNPCTGEIASGDVTRVTLSSNATDGKNPLYPVSFTAVASCAPDSLLAKLPAGAVGVAGLARSSLAFPAQVAETQRVANRFALCLPSGRGTAGVAIFGGGPFFLLPPGRLDSMEALVVYTPLHKHDGSPGYYISADKGIAVDRVQVPPVGGKGAPLVVGLCSTIPYTALRSDVYGPVVKAFAEATAGRARIPAVRPFELCYDMTELASTRVGYPVPAIELMLEGGQNWTMFGANSMVDVNDTTACLGFVEMKKADVKQQEYGGAAPAVVIGGYQMEDNLVVFDEEKQRLGFSGLLLWGQTTCSNFNFTMAAAAA